jgi:ABC-2 type transport system ATP-binding protein
MQEVEAICDRVIIINKGMIVADDKTSELSKLVTHKQIIAVEFDKAPNADKLKKLPGVTRVQMVKGNLWEIESGVATDLRPEIFRFAVDNGLTVLSQQVKEQQSIQEVFQMLTK